MADLSVAVHQPNYLPWCGYFAKMLSSDVFVFLDDVQLPQGRSPVSRAKIGRGEAGDQWLTVPVTKHGRPAIRDVCFADPHWAKRHLKTLEYTYGRARFFEEIIELTRPVYEDPGAHLSLANQWLIERIARYVGWEGEFVRSSDKPSSKSADERIAELVVAMGGKRYISGAGGMKYQDPETYARMGIELVVHTYHPKPYERSGSQFVPGLSIVDALFHCGPRSSDLLSRSQGRWSASSRD